MVFPQKCKLAFLPTPIIKLYNSFNLHRNKDTAIYMKRDDMTGSEMSGNKVRKLEYQMFDALANKVKVVITCGALQSNHCRAVAAVASRLRLECELVLVHDGMKRGDLPTSFGPALPYCENNGNYLAAKLLGAKITFVSPYDYEHNRTQIMENLRWEYAECGKLAYVLPEGSSNGIGVFGYMEAFYEILEFERQNSIRFDTICVATGSGGTLAGLAAGNEISGEHRNIAAFSVSKKDDSYRKKIEHLINDARRYTSFSEISMKNVYINNEYYGKQYGVPTKEQVAFIKSFAKHEGVLCDPVYTGKALYGLFEEVSKGNPLFKGKVLFIHTGGQYGLFPKRDYLTDDGAIDG